MRLVIALTAVMLLAPAAAQAAPLALRAATPVDRVCTDRLLDDAAPGAALARVTAPGTGAFVVRTTGGPGDGDWDLALFDAGSGRRLAGSATFGAREMATAYVAPGQVVAIQACRRTGGTSDLEATSDFFALPAGVAEPAQLLTVRADGPGDVERLEALGLDVTHQATDRTVDVIAYRAAERAELRAAGFDFTVKQADLGAADERTLSARGDSRAAAALPSGRTTYREYADYGNDLKALADDHPDRVRKVTLPEPSLENRPIEGVEIAAGAGRTGDGRPIFLLSGLTHAREWPGGEAAMEFATDLARSSDPRMVAIRERVRVIVLPVLNPDGFVVSRDIGGAGMEGGDDTNEDVTLPLALGDSGAYKRKNCRALEPSQQGSPCASRAPFGVDLNRAYGAFWGGAGTSTNPATQQFRGPAPFSEPEAVAVRKFGAANQIQTFITNHTYTDVGRFLRQPGFDIPNDPVPPTVPDEPIFAELGDAMAAATGYVSELGYATLGNITGPSDDFLYYSQGTIGYTPELRGDNFHTNHASAVVGEYEGKGDKVGRGLREAYMLAAEQAADRADHAVFAGRAPAGRVLRLARTTQLTTSDDEDGDGTKDKEAMVFDERLDTTITVPASGSYEWDVNPSTRPLAPVDEAWTFTCETPGGTVLERHDIVIDRGQTAAQDFTCTEGVAPAPNAVPTPPRPPRGGAPAAGSNPPAGSSLTPFAPRPATPGTTTRARLRVALRRPPASARGTARSRGLRVYVSLRGGRLRAVRLRLVDRRGRTIASGSRSELTRSTRVRLRTRRRPQAGLHRVVLTARDGSNRPVRAARTVRLRR